MPGDGLGWPRGTGPSGGGQEGAGLMPPQMVGRTASENLAKLGDRYVVSPGRGDSQGCVKEGPSGTIEGKLGQERGHRGVPEEASQRHPDGGSR